MDIRIRCYHSPSIHILHCCRCCHHCNRSCTSSFHNHHRSSFLCMDIHIRCYHSPSIHILHCCRCCLHCNHSCTSRIHHHMGCLMSIRSLRSKRCSHHCIRIHCMGIHIRILCMGCKHRSSMILSCNLRNQRTSNFHNHHRSSFLRMGIHIRCYHSPSIHILHCCRCFHHCNRSCTSRIHHHMGCVMTATLTSETM